MATRTLEVLQGCACFSICRRRLCLLPVYEYQWHIVEYNSMYLLPTSNLFALQDLDPTDGWNLTTSPARHLATTWQLLHFRLPLFAHLPRLQRQDPMLERCAQSYVGKAPALSPILGSIAPISTDRDSFSSIYTLPGNSSRVTFRE